MLDGEVWVGTNGGGVSRLTPNLVLPSVSSGMFSLGMSSDERRAVATDGKRVVVWDLTTGKELASLDTQGGTSQPARAVTFVGEDTEDVVIALFDGTLERRTVTALTEVAAASEPLADCPHTLGSLGPLVVAFTGFASPAKPTGALLVNPADFGSIQPNTDAGVDVTAMRRVGYWFAGTGELEGTRMAVIAREHLVVQHGRLLTVTPGAREWVRIAKDEQFIR